jgi:hypothetical protein
VRRSVLCCAVWQESIFIFVVKTFSHLIYFIKTFYKRCTFIVVCKNYAAISSVTVLRKKKFVPVSFSSHSMLVNK